MTLEMNLAALSFAWILPNIHVQDTRLFSTGLDVSCKCSQNIQVSEYVITNRRDNGHVAMIGIVSSTHRKEKPDRDGAAAAFHFPLSTLIMTVDCFTSSPLRHLHLQALLPREPAVNNLPILLRMDQLDIV